MTSKIKVDNINKVSDDSNIINKCGTTVTVGAASDGVRTGANNLQASDGGNLISQSGTTITLGASGDTIALASGASQTGFGREGSVNWQTGSIKTATFTAASGEGYFCNTSGGAFTVNLPAGSAGAIVSVSDYTRTFATNNLTINPNGSEKIGGIAQDLILNINGQALTLIYVDGTEGWINVQNAEDTEIGQLPTFIAATGGTVTTVCTNFKVHTFTGPGTFSVSAVGNAAGSNTVDYLVIAGGGGGGSDQGGGGGAGGYRESPGTASGSYSVSPLGVSPAVALPVTAIGFPITVGGGGQGAIIGCRAGANGNTSTFSSISSAGGGKAGTLNSPGVGSAGGSGGGGSHGGCGGAGGVGNTPPVSPPQGTPGGNAPGSSDYGAGGGGATSAGVNGNPGGAGATSSITGSAVGRAGGGGGRSSSGPAGVPFGAGTYTPNPGPGAQNGTANTGSGAGGSGVGGPAPTNTGGTGGSGIVIIRYKFQ